MEKQPLIGVLTWRSGKRFSEPDYLRRLVLAGADMGVKLFLFSHQDVFADKQKIRGFVPKGEKEWQSRWFSWPQVVIDRYRRRVPAYMRLRNSNLFRFANSPFGKKWKVTQILSRDARVKHWIPETSLYAPGKVQAMLKRHSLVYVKPGNGTGGKSILRVEKTGRGYRLMGRDHKLEKRSACLQNAAAVERWVRRWVSEEKLNNGNFLVQQGVRLASPRDRVADVRLLIQKDEQGVWHVTGAGVRVGEPGSATSNLHGGGRAIPLPLFLAHYFGGEKVEAITQACKQMAREVVEVLEERYGCMMEFGLDIGVDLAGRPWLIEVNPKPGREVFVQMGDMETYEQAIRRPVQFALYVLQEEGRGK